jgi:uncharacterized protein
MLEARVLGGGENPPRALQLVDPAEALQPWRVEKVLLSGPPWHSARPALGDAKVSVDGIAGKIDARVLERSASHSPIIGRWSTSYEHTVTTGLEQGIELFNNGRYWEAHEAWEHDWMPDRKGPDSGFYKGLIQVAAGCLHYTRRNRRGAVNKWRSGADYLRPYLPAHLSVDVAALVKLVDTYLEAMGASGWPELTMPQLEARPYLQ